MVGNRDALRNGQGYIVHIEVRGQRIVSRALEVDLAELSELRAQRSQELSDEGEIEKLSS